MEYLLDTHAFLWFINGDSSLSAAALQAISSPYSIKYISIASFWEIAIKLNTGKLFIDMPFDQLRTEAEVNGFDILQVTFEHTARLIDLELHHRIHSTGSLIAQAETSNMTLISKDSNFSSYIGLKLLW